MSKFEPSFYSRYASTERLLPSKAFVELIQAVLDKGAAFRLRAKGASMFPFIHDGDILTIRRIQRKVKIGDVVAAKHPDVGKLVIHRIVARKGSRYKIKGDSNIEQDGWVSENDLLGLIAIIERGKKKIEPGGRVVRRFISFVSRCAWLRWIKFSIYRRILSVGEVF